MAPDTHYHNSRIPLPLVLLAGFIVFVFLIAGVYRPDRPVTTIVSGSSSGPTFVVQVIRPRLGLPLGGLLPPQFFGQEAHLGFPSSSAGASIGSVGPERLELSADDWDLIVVLDDDGHVAPGTQVVFELLFEERLRRVRCRPGDPAVGTLGTTVLPDSGGLSGNFDIELAHCEDADTGTPLGWPPQPLILHGSFDRLPLDAGAQRPCPPLTSESAKDKSRSILALGMAGRNPRGVRMDVRRSLLALLGHPARPRGRFRARHPLRVTESDDRLPDPGASGSSRETTSPWRLQGRPHHPPCDVG